MRNIRIFWILTATVFVCLLIPTLVQEGMFLDGITYSAISKNMANGYGSFWDPHYTKVLYPHFHEHPPLVFTIQSYFFKVFGDSFFTERIYSLFIAIISMIGIAQCWRLLTEQTELKEYDWLPVLLWVSIPLVSWSYMNNLLENTMGVFTIFSVFYVLKSIVERKSIYLLFGSILIVLAFLSKGFSGIFPLVVPILYAVIYKPNKTTILYSVYLIILTAIVSFFISKVIPESKNNIIHYFDQQLIPSLNNQKEITTNNRLSIILNLVVELSFPIILLIYLIIKLRLKNTKIDFFKNKMAMIFLLIALSASLPLIISLKQRNFYLIPSIPFYILSISILLAPFVKEKLDKISALALKWIKMSSFIVLLVVLIFSISRFGKFSRDKEKLTDIYTISRVIPKGTIISTTKNLWADWSLVAYMSRIGYLSLDCDNKHKYLLIENDNLEPGILNEYEIMDLQLTKYIMLQRKN